VAHKFSVGKIKLDSVEIGLATGITVSSDGDPQELRAADHRLPAAIELGGQSVEITAETAKFDIDADGQTILDNSYVDVELEAGANGGGLVGTITRCKIVSYEVVSTQDGFVVSTMVLRKAADTT
jgi:hypothetical protein